MVLDSLSSPHRRAQNAYFSSPQKPRTAGGRDEPADWATLLDRHRFLLTMLALLAFLCTVYLYFAVTLGTRSGCAGMDGAQRAVCEAQRSLKKGKLKF